MQLSAPETLTNPITKNRFSAKHQPLASEFSILKLGFGLSGNSFKKTTERFVREEQFRSFFAGNTHMQLLGIPGLISTYIAVYPVTSTVQISWFVFTALEFVVQFFLLLAFGRETERRKFQRRNVYFVYFAMMMWISVAVGTIPLILDDAASVDAQKLFLYFVFLIWTFFVTWWCSIFPVMSFCGLTVMVAGYLLTSKNTGIIGQIEWTLLGMYPLYLIFFWRQWRVFIDNTLLRNELRQSRDDVSLALAEFENSAEDWLFETDTEGRIGTVPPRMREAAAPLTLLENKTKLADLFVDGTGGHYTLLTSFHTRTPIRDLVLKLRSPATEQYWKLRGRPFFDEDAQFVGMRFVATDFSESHALQTAAAERERYDAIVRMTAIIAHDFNNYLATIVGSLDVLEIRDQLSPAGKSAVQNARKGATQASKVTHDLLSFTNDQQLISSKHVNCLTAVQDVSQDIVVTHGQKLNFQIAIDNHLHVLADPVAFQRALRNLMENAAKAMSYAGTIKITAVVTDKDKVAISIRDYGPGIPNDVMEKVFEPFFTTRRSDGGTGLGLAMVKGFARKSEGKVFLRNANPGIEAVLTLPSVLPLPEPVEIWSTARFEQRDFAGKTALLVEDNLELQGVLREFLLDLGFEVLAVESLGEIQQRTASLEKLDLIISDVVLPDGHSFQAVEDLKSARPEPPAVLYISGFSKVQSPEGANVLLKPFALADLLERIHASLSPEPQSANS